MVNGIDSVLLKNACQGENRNKGNGLNVEEIRKYLVSKNVVDAGDNKYIKRGILQKMLCKTIGDASRTSSRTPPRPSVPPVSTRPSVPRGPPRTRNEFQSQPRSHNIEFGTPNEEEKHETSELMHKTSRNVQMSAEDYRESGGKAGDVCDRENGPRCLQFNQHGRATWRKEKFKNGPDCNTEEKVNCDVQNTSRPSSSRSPPRASSSRSPRLSPPTSSSTVVRPTNKGPNDEECENGICRRPPKLHSTTPPSLVGDGDQESPGTYLKRVPPKLSPTMPPSPVGDPEWISALKNQVIDISNNIRTETSKLDEGDGEYLADIVNHLHAVYKILKEHVINNGKM